MTELPSNTASKIGKLYIGDNLEVMRNDIPPNYADLIYLDPPFNSKRNYNCNFEDEGQTFGFEDTWNYLQHKKATDDEYTRIENQSDKLSHFLQFVKEGAIKDSNHFAYLTFMASRLLEMKKILKPTGSIYLHVDPTESHYLKIVMDLIFGVENFRNEIIWSYSTGGISKSWFAQKHDVILFYTKTSKYRFTPIKTTSKDPKRFNLIDETNGNHYYIKSGNRYYLEDGVTLTDVWDVYPVRNVSKERLGYPTQKPEALLERIISASCPLDGVMIDPFCGCGTSCAVAAKKGIRFVGIDITSKAKEVILKRFLDAGVPEPEIIDRPSNVVEASRLAASDKYGSQRETCKKLGLINHEKKGADGGIDGHQNYRLKDGSLLKLVASVKAGAATLSQLRDLIGVVSRDRSDIGVFVINSRPTNPMLQEIDRHGYIDQERTPKIQILVLEDVYAGQRIKLPEGALIVGQ